MSEIPRSNPEIEQTREWTDEEAARLLFLSFKFSQGDMNTQTKIFAWLKVNYPERTLPENIEGIKTKSTEVIKKFFNHPKKLHTSMGDNEADLDQTVNVGVVAELGAWQAVQKQEVIKETNAELVKLILENTIASDYKFLVSKNDVNPTRSMKGERHLVDYVLNLKPTGAPEFDELFRQANALYHSDKTIQESLKRQH